MQPKALLLRLHCALAGRDYSGALAALHRYFDHVQVRGAQGRVRVRVCVRAYVMETCVWVSRFRVSGFWSTCFVRIKG